jgi:hypothetical protein
MEEENPAPDERKPYEKPLLRTFGEIEELTETGGLVLDGFSENEIYTS